MMSYSNRKYAFWLLSNNSLTTTKKRKLFEYFTDAYQLYLADKLDIKNSQILQDDDELYAYTKQKEGWDIDGEYERFLHSGFDFVTLEDEAYPTGLQNIHDRPYGLFINGTMPTNTNQFIAMVGARTASAYGKKMAIELAGGLARCGYTIVSGLARGIDAFSHQGCLDAGGKTIAVLGCGVDVVYPMQNAALYEQIAENGCIVSEYPPGTPPVATQFPARNRIISGLCKKVIVVEAKKRSGSLITADFALAQGRDLYAVPGRVGDALSLGCNELIYQGAGIITSLEAFMKDNLEMSNSMYTGTSVSAADTNSLAREEAIVYSCLDLYPKSFEDILIEAKLEFLEVLAAIAGLMRLGIIKEVFKNYYIRLG